MSVVDEETGETVAKATSGLGFVGRNFISTNAESEFYGLLHFVEKTYAKSRRDKEVTF